MKLQQSLSLKIKLWTAPAGEGNPWDGLWESSTDFFNRSKQRPVGPVSSWGSLWAVRLNFILEPHLHRDMDREISFLKIFAVGVFVCSQWLLKSFGCFGDTSDLYKDWQREMVSRLNICGHGVVWAQCEFSLLWLNTDCSKQEWSKAIPSMKQKSADMLWPFVHHLHFLNSFVQQVPCSVGLKKMY